MQQAPKTLLTQLYQAAVDAALPAKTLAAALPAPPKGKTGVIGAGKASGAMAHAVESLWPATAPMSGVVITRYGHTPPRAADLSHRITVLEAAHPVPDAAGLAAAQQVLNAVRGLSADDLVLCLISGGGSSLLSIPSAQLSFADKQAVNRALLHSGASIGEMNCVRKHLSAIKGGRLAAACYPAQVVTLLISDVPGDDPAVIASGPTVPDASTCADALAIVSQYGITLPTAALAALKAGTLETPKPHDALFTGHSVKMLATPRMSLNAAAAKARALGIDAYILSDDLEGESAEIAKMHAALARSVVQHNTPFIKRPDTPLVILSGGETTVTVRPEQKATLGRGGRAGEFCLSLAKDLNSLKGVYALAADTDGIDGIETNAGAFVAPDTLARAASLGLKAADYLARHDSYAYFEGLGELFVTGPSYTNVNDFRAILIM